MALETATFIADLVGTNPPGTDKKKQGDDHLRLIKNVLQAQFPGGNRAFPIPSSVAKTTDYVVLTTDQNKTIYVSTAAGAVNLTLPTLTSADNGWQVNVMKSTLDVNPIFVLPPSGTLISGQLNTLTKTRRAVPFVRFACMWVEGNWIIERCIRMPVATVLDAFRTDLPFGYEWAGGVALSSAANYPDYNATTGALVNPDCRGRATYGKDVLGGAAASRLVGIIAGNTLGAAGGTDTVTLAQAALPNFNLSWPGITISDPTHTHGTTDPLHAHNFDNIGGAPIMGSGGSFGSPSGGVNSGTTTANASSIGVSANSTGITAAISGGVLNSGGSSQAHSNLAPAIVMNKYVVVE